MLIYRIVIKPSNGTNNYCASLSNFYQVHYNSVVWNAGLNCGRSSHCKPYLTSATSSGLYLPIDQALIRDGPELWHMATGSTEGGQQEKIV
jgi:hypothetical protein